MGLKLIDPIAEARGVLLDTDQTGYRYSDADLLRYANDSLDEIMALVPYYFHSDGEIECTPNQCLQELPWDKAAGLVDIISLKNGPAITRVERLSLDRYRPAWMQDPAGPAVNWMPIDGSPMKFLLYPKAPEGQIIKAIYVRVSDEYLAGDDTGLPPSLEPAITDYVVYRAESRDDEHVVSQRAAMFLASFVARFKKVEAVNG